MRRHPLEPFMMEVHDGDLVIEVMESFDGHLIFFDEHGESLPEASFSPDELNEIDERAAEVRLTGEDKHSRFLRRCAQPLPAAALMAATHQKDAA